MRRFFNVRTIGSAWLALTVTVWTGCSPAISKAVRKEVNPAISYEQIRDAPDKYIGEMVLIGGEVIQTRNTTQGSLLYVLQKDLDYRGKPHKDDRSGGRFLVQDPRFLDPAIYRAGRLVTVAGRVMGKQVRKIDELDYTYPILHAEEIHLWPDEPGGSEYYFYPHPIWYFSGVYGSSFPPWY